MRMRMGRSLQSMSATVALIVVVLALLVSGALVVLTSALHRTTASNAASVESVRLAAEAGGELTRNDPAEDALAERERERRIRRRVADAKRFVTSTEEARVLSEVAARIDAYLASRAELERVAALDALADLVTINVAQSKASQREAARWDHLGNVLGLGVGVLLIVVGAGVVLWLRGGAFAPLLALADTMNRFGRGEREARAAERGPRELCEMSARFNEMCADAAQRRTQIAFLGGVAHDLRTPLATLQLSMGMLDEAPGVQLEPQLRRATARIHRQLARMDRMLEDLLDAMRIHEGKLELQVELHDARDVVADVVEMFEGTAEDHRVVVHLPEHEALVRCDAVRIGQVVANLVSNAIKYSPGGTDVVVAVEPRGDLLAVTVTDQGVGIRAEELAVIFEPFRRVGLHGSVPGVGLGLFVVREIVAMHGGRVEVQSIPGQGSTFRVLLPAA